MSLRPVDLNAMYLQMDRASLEAARQTQGGQISQAIQNDLSAKKLQEQKKIVEATEKSKNNVAVDEKGGHSAAGGGEKKKSKRDGGDEPFSAAEDYVDPDTGHFLNCWL